MVRGEVPSELQPSQNDIIITDDYSSPSTVESIAHTFAIKVAAVKLHYYRLLSYICRRKIVEVPLNSFPYYIGEI